MTYLAEWNAIVARIEGLTAAMQLHAALLGVRDSDSFNTGGYLGAQYRGALLSIQSFGERFRGELPAAVTAAIDGFVKEKGDIFKEAAEGPDVKYERLRAAVVLLPALTTQISHLLRDGQPLILARSELAFAHLQRLIAADPEIQKKWQATFKAGEVKCEKLGAAHLLSHGIWAFKVSAAKGITDLIFQDMPVTEAPEIRRRLSAH